MITTYIIVKQFNKDVLNMNEVSKTKKYLDVCTFSIVLNECLGFVVMYEIFKYFKNIEATNVILAMVTIGCILWSLLLLIQGSCGFFIWKEGKINKDNRKLVNKGLRFYFIQLVLQLLGPITLIKSQNMSLSFFQTLVTLLVIIGTTKLFKKVDYEISKYMNVFLFIYGISIVIFYWLYITALNL